MSASLPSLVLASLLPLAGGEPPEVPDVYPMPVSFGETDHAAYREAAQKLEDAGADFPAIFRASCARARSRGGSSQEVKVMLAGLVTWLGDRDKPRSIGLQDRTDWAFHFTYGAWLESIAAGLGERAALDKERKDAFDENNGYDLGDLAVTFIGARWARQEVPRLGEWASGKRRLEDLPVITFPKLPHGVMASEAQIQAVRAFVPRALP